MQWLTLSIIAGVLYYFYRHGKSASKPASAAPPKPEKTARGPASKPQEQGLTLENILEAGNIEALKSELKKTTDPFDRHRIYSRIVELTYPRRDTLEMREQLVSSAEAYIEEFESLKPAIDERFGEEADLVLPFKRLIMVLEEAGDYEKAAALCHQAIDWGLDDGTKTGYQGRMRRIRKKLERTDQ